LGLWIFGRDTRWCLRISEADSFVVWLTLGNTAHGKPKKGKAGGCLSSWPADGICLVYQSVGASWAPRRAEGRHFTPPCTWHEALGRGVLWLGAAHREQRGPVPRQQRGHFEARLSPQTRRGRPGFALFPAGRAGRRPRRAWQVPPLSIIAATFVRLDSNCQLAFAKGISTARWPCRLARSSSHP
jgi:hypothetical protein